jgi:FlaA1/EpsC-like NDP-sugar epimerase
MSLPKLNEMNAKHILRIRLKYGPKIQPWLVHIQTKWLLDGLSGALSIVLAYGLRFDMNVPTLGRNTMWAWAVLLFFVTPLVLSVAGGYRVTWQFFGARDFTRLALRAIPISIALAIVRTFTPAYAFVPYSVIFIDYGLLLAFTAAIRMLRRLDHEAVVRLSYTERVLVIGTSQTIGSAIRQLQTLYGRCLIGAVTDEPSLKGMRIAGVPVLGKPSELRRIISTNDVDLLFLCSADLPDVSEVIQVAAEFDVSVKFLPSPQDLVDNRVRVSKNITVDALRVYDRHSPTDLHPAVIECLTDQTVLITGAGGSIGSELARQISTIKIKRLLLLDQDENSIFELLNELGQRPQFSPIIADIRDRDAITALFVREKPDVILHAAAYKHVPMMEQNPCEAVMNNIHGTRVLVETAVQAGVGRFVMISSDKAVRPSSVMGATKRVAEVLIQNQAHATRGTGRTQFACVRFGNVLGSRGSVLPVFLRQIAAGGPLTITHEDMTRYFMTIPQAVRLVLQAATLASAGDVYMLDMGDPVRIMDFARDVVELSGLTIGRDIQIEVVGTRPGEKLHEQLWSEDAYVTPTEFTHVFRVKATEVPSNFHSLLDGLQFAARERNAEEVRSLLHSLPIDFRTEQTDTIAAVLARVS